MDDNTFRVRRRNLPHWTMEGSTYFITFRTHTGTLLAEERRLVLEHVQSGHGMFYRLAAIVVMPDHVHLLLSPLPPYDLTRVMKGIKGVTARRINTRRKVTGAVWQDESWDRIVRDETEFIEKLQYMADNPVKTGLVTSMEKYDSLSFNFDFLAGDS